MTVDQALHEMELVGHDFFLFQCADTGQPTVVYRRHAYDYGLIRLTDVPLNGAGPAHAPQHAADAVAAHDLTPGREGADRAPSRTAQSPASRPNSTASPRVPSRYSRHAAHDALLREPRPPRRRPARRRSATSANRCTRGAPVARAPTPPARARPRRRSPAGGPTGAIQ